MERELLSAAGKEIMIKAVTQAIPTYVMNCFELPRYLCDNMHRLMASFWWGDSEDKSKIHWLSWEKTCAAKKEGGLSFKEMHVYVQLSPPSETRMAYYAMPGYSTVKGPKS